jgi:hypothetical protein
MTVTTETQLASVTPVHPKPPVPSQDPILQSLVLDQHLTNMLVPSVWVVLTLILLVSVLPEIVLAKLTARPMVPAALAVSWFALSATLETTLTSMECVKCVLPPRTVLLPILPALVLVKSSTVLRVMEAIIK